MRRNFILLFTLAVMLLGCRSRSEVLPSATWSAGCIQLAPYQGAYQLSGMCCTYVLLPQLKLDSQGLFAVDGSYHSFTGAGFSDVPTRITGQVSPDNTMLTLQYTVNGAVSRFTLRPGYATASCYCACD